jgi:hypothetical protein
MVSIHRKKATLSARNSFSSIRWLSDSKANREKEDPVGRPSEAHPGRLSAVIIAIANVLAFFKKNRPI